MQRVLSFEQTPPLAVPLRFFLTAPAFAAAAALLLLWHGDAVLVSRWSPLTLAFTHLLTLGFLGLCMIGSVLQIMPVVAGVEIPRPTLVAKLVHGLLSAGAAMLAAGFLWMVPLLFQGALVLLAAAFGTFLCACWLGLKEVESENVTFKALRLTLVALTVTVVLGMLLGSLFAWPIFSLPALRLTDLHAAWGLAGWVGLLVAAVAYQVVPMFQITEIYPRILTQWLARGIFGLLIVLSLSAVLMPAADSIVQGASIIAAVFYVAFAGMTWHLIRRRKRPKPEPTTFFWYLSLASLMAACLLFILGQLYPAAGNHPAYSFGLGALFLVGFGYSVINGMLYKIVPFLVWYHLQDRLFDAGLKAPNVRQVISENAARRQFFSHATALLLLLGSVLWPHYLTRIAAFSLLISSCWLGFNLIAAAHVYRGWVVRANTAPHNATS